MADRIKVLRAELAQALVTLGATQDRLADARHEAAETQGLVRALEKLLRDAGVNVDGPSASRSAKRRKRRRSTPTLADLAAEVLQAGPMTTEALVKAVNEKRKKQTTENSLNSSLHRESPERFVKDRKTKLWQLVERHR